MRCSRCSKARRRSRSSKPTATPVAVAKALSDAAKDTKILALRGGVLSGNPITGAEIESLAKLPPLEVLQAQLVGVIVAPLTQLAAVLNAPLQNLVGLIDARITQLEEGGDTSAAAEVALRSRRRPAVDEAAVEEAPPRRRSRGGRRRGGRRRGRGRRDRRGGDRRDPGGVAGGACLAALRQPTRERNETRWQRIRQRCSRRSAR